MDEGKIQEILFKYRWYVLGAILGIILILLGIVSITRQLPFFEENKIEILSENATGEVIVEIAGAIEKPGVYKFSVGSRIDDLLITSGGLSASADREWIERTLNRAAKLTDGQKVYIPEVTQSSRLRQGFGGQANVKSFASNNLININEASQAELEELTGIGPVTAKKIIENRPYSAVEELITRKVLKQSVYEDNKDKLSIY